VNKYAKVIPGDLQEVPRIYRAWHKCFFVTTGQLGNHQTDTKSYTSIFKVGSGAIARTEIGNEIGK